MDEILKDCPFCGSKGVKTVCCGKAIPDCPSCSDLFGCHHCDLWMDTLAAWNVRPAALSDDGWTYCGGREPENGWYLTQWWDGSMRVEEYYFAVRARWAKNVVAYRPLLRLIQSIIRYLEDQIKAAYLCRDNALFNWYSEGQEAFVCIIQEKPITRTQRVKDLQPVKGRDI